MDLWQGCTLQIVAPSCSNGILSIFCSWISKHRQHKSLPFRRLHTAWFDSVLWLAYHLRWPQGLDASLGPGRAVLPRRGIIQHMVRHFLASHLFHEENLFFVRQDTNFWSQSDNFAFSWPTFPSLNISRQWTDFSVNLSDFSDTKLTFPSIFPGSQESKRVQMSAGKSRLSMHAV